MIVESGNERSRNWILSFADLLSLLLCFMVMTFAMTNIAREERQPAETEATRSLAETIARPGGNLPSADARSSAGRITPTRALRALDLDYLAAILNTTLPTDRLFREVRVERTGDRLVLAMPADLFTPGETRIADEAMPSLEALARVLNNLENPIDVLGRAGGEPLPAGEEASYWDLSLSRALAVAEVLASSGLARPVASYGLADAGPHELPDNQREQMARRVDLVVYATAGE